MATHCFRPQSCKSLITIDRRTSRLRVPDAYRCATIATVTQVTSSQNRHTRRFNSRTRQWFFWNSIFGGTSRQKDKFFQITFIFTPTESHRKRYFSKIKFINTHRLDVELLQKRLFSLNFMKWRCWLLHSFSWYNRAHFKSIQSYRVHVEVVWNLRGFVARIKGFRSLI